MDDKWIDSIRDKMADYDVAPPAGLLEAVEAKVRAGRMRRRRIFGAIAASIALIGTVSVALIPDMPEVAPGPLVSDGGLGKTGKEDNKEIKDDFVNQMAETTTASRPKSIGTESRGIGLPASSTLQDVVGNMDETEVYGEETPTGSEPYVPPKRAVDNFNMEYDSDVKPVAPRSDMHTPLSVGISASANGLGGIFGDDGIGHRPLLASASLPRTRMGGGMLGSPNTVDPPAPRFIEVFDHKLPVRASVDLSWPIGYDLSIGTGLTYSYLRSDISYGYSDSPLFKASQSLHFIGIPVNVRYTPWSFRKFDIYASAGLMAEKCVAGGIKTDNPQNPTYGYVGCDDRPFQFSVNAAVGLQYSLAGRCAVFIEPGLGFYMKNGSRLRTIYTERPLTFNVNVGLRFGK